MQIGRTTKRAGVEPAEAAPRRNRGVLRPFRNWTCAASRLWLLLVLLTWTASFAAAQKAPEDSSRIWVATRGTPSSVAPSRFTLDSARVYTLADLVDLAEQHNPATRIAWERAKARAAAVGVARSALFPVLAAGAISQSVRQAVLFNTQWYQQTEGIFEPMLSLTYTVFDFNNRFAALGASKASLLAQDFSFNQTHLDIIYRVTAAYYRLLDSAGQLRAARADLQNADIVASNAKARLANGLATLPDVLEASSAAAQANYQLVTAEGNVTIAQGALATAVGASPASVVKIVPLRQIAPPAALDESADEAIRRALRQRPDLLSQVARIKATQKEIARARSSFYPTIAFSGNIGDARAYGEQLPLPGVYASGELWNAQLNLQWNLFEGGLRRRQLAQAEADQRAARAQLANLRDQAEDQVWIAYTNVQTSYAQQQAASALVRSAQTSYDAALDAYRHGVRTLIDVIAAQRALAEARSEEITARTRLLRNTAALAFRTGDLLGIARHP